MILVPELLHRNAVQTLKRYVWPQFKGAYWLAGLIRSLEGCKPAPLPKREREADRLRRRQERLRVELDRVENRLKQIKLSGK